jgi:hypothetical protein
LEKYQFSIFEYNGATNNSAATKAVLDCTRLYTQSGYKEHVLTFNNNSKRGFSFYKAAFLGICSFLLSVNKRAIVGSQYPMLNNVFKYFIMLASVKKVKFFCVIHDIESLRLGGRDMGACRREAANLNYYSCLIVHNDLMKQWLTDHGVTTKMVSLGVFDYLRDNTINKPFREFSKTVVYAGNLGKSKFVYQLSAINNWNFNLYGPNFTDGSAIDNASWRGVFSPDKVADELTGDFGLIWDGDRIDKPDEILGNYLKFNNPHKFSLYLAAGLPVIAPANAAIAQVIKENNIGILITSLTELNQIEVSSDEYRLMKQNVLKLQERVVKGDYFQAALQAVESLLSEKA